LELFSNLTANFGKTLTRLSGDFFSSLNSAVEILLRILGWLLLAEELISGLMCYLPAVISGRRAAILRADRSLLKTVVLFKEIPQALVPANLHRSKLVRVPHVTIDGLNVGFIHTQHRNMCFRAFITNEGPISNVGMC
jgi:hypothetical protein